MAKLAWILSSVPRIRSGFTYAVCKSTFDMQVSAGFCMDFKSLTYKYPCKHRES